MQITVFANATLPFAGYALCTNKNLLVSKTVTGKKVNLFTAQRNEKQNQCLSLDAI